MVESGFMLEAITNSYSTGTGGIDVNIQDQTTPPVQYYLMSEQKTDITLSTAIEKDTITFNVSAGHGFSTASSHYMSIWDNQRYFQSKISAVSTNQISVEIPTASSFTTNATVIRGIIDMNIDASSTAVNFDFCPRNSTIAIDIRKATVTMQHTVAGDDSKFGGITALTSGMYFRQYNGITLNLGNYKNNQNFREHGAVITYTDKAGGGNNATNITFDIVDHYGVVLRVDPRTNDCLRAVIRDDLSTTTLIQLRIGVFGQLTQGE